MAALESCPKHNMIAYLEKTDGNTEFHEIMDFLTRSSIYYALTVSPVVSTTFVEQFWMSAKSKTINNVRYITATVAGKPVTISEASIRSDLLFDDADGIDTLNNQAIFDTIQLMGYEGDLTVLTFNKALFSPQWKFLFHTMNHCISSKSTSWDQIPTNIATTLKNVPIPLDHFPINALTSKVLSFMVKKGKNFSGNVTPLFDSMLVQPTEDEPDPSLRPSPSIPILDSNPEGSGGNHGGQSSSDISLSGNEDGLTLQSVYDLCISLCKQSVSMKTRLAGKKSMQKKWMQKESVSKQGRKTAKSKPTAHKDQAFDDPDDFDAIDYMETEDAHNEKGIDKGTAELKNGNSDENATPTATPTVFGDDETIAEFLVSMSQNKAKQKGVEIKDAEDSNRPRPTSTRSLLTLKPLPKIDPKDKGKKVLEEEAESDAESEGVNEAERKFAQLANDEEIARKARIEADSILAARLQEEEREKFTIEERAKLLHDTIAAQRRFLAQQRAAEIRKESKEEESTRKRKLGTRKKIKSRKRRFRQDTSQDDQTDSEKENDELRLCLTIATDEDKEVDYEILDKKYPIIEWKTGEDINAVYQLVMDRYQDEIPEGFDRVLWGDLMIMFNPSDEDEFWNSQQDWNVVSWKLHGSLGVHTLMTEAGLVIHMLVEKKYPLRRKVLLQMLELKLESEEDSTMALELIRFVKKLIAELEPEDSDGNKEDL
ncbi:hypothetical protein Tco_0359584 [Tanacetum coccineum]